MLKIGREANFPLESFWPQGRQQIWMQDLERDLTMMPQIAHQVYCGHAPAPELVFKLVAFAKGLFQPIGQLGHGLRLKWGLPESVPAYYGRLA